MTDAGRNDGAGRWPFLSSPETPVISLKSIIHAGAPVLLVRHEARDDLWQFLGDGAWGREDGLLVSLATLLDHDPTLAELADLRPGWSAIRRSPDAPWVRRPIRAPSSAPADGEPT